MTVIDLLLFGVIVGLAAIGMWAVHRLRHVGEQNVQEDKFFAAANKLADDDRVPDRLLRVLRMMGRTIRLRPVLWMLALHAVNGKLRMAASQNEPEYLAFSHLIEDLPSEPKKLMNAAMVHYVLALTYSDLVLGTVIRRTLLYQVPNNGDTPPSPGVQPIVADVAHCRFHRKLELA